MAISILPVADSFRNRICRFSLINGAFAYVKEETCLHALKFGPQILINANVYMEKDDRSPYRAI